MGMTLNERNPNIVLIPLGTQAATVNLPGMFVRKHSRIKSVQLINKAAVAASDVDYVVVALKDSNGNSYASYDSRPEAQGALVALIAGQAKLLNPDLVIDAPATPLAEQEVNIPSLTNLEASVTIGGAGALTAALLEVEYYPL